MMRFYIHPTTKRYLDYGDLLDTVEGISWSTDGDPGLVWGFEEGQTFESIRARLFSKPEAASVVELVKGPAVVRSFDMNPHGLI